MKRSLYVLATTALGATLGALIASRLVRFVPICGEDCSAEAFSVFLTWVGAGVVFFATLGFIWSRKLSRERRYEVTKLMALTVAFSLAGVGMYLHKLEQENAYLYSIREIQPTNDFSEIVIARQPISVFTDGVDGQARIYYTISAWERCTLGYADINQRPPHIEIACRKGIGWIPKDQETNLIRVEHEQPSKK